MRFLLIAFIVFLKQVMSQPPPIRFERVVASQIRESPSKSPYEPLITGGKAATEGEFPFQVSIQAKSKKGGGSSHFCGGSILTENRVITAAHCTDGQDPTRIVVVAGAHNMKDATEPSQQRVGVERLIGNPKYNSWTINFDSAIIALAENLTFNERVQPIRLPPAGHEPSGKCVSSGWGNANRLGLRPVIIPNVLQKVNMTIVTRGVCRIPYLFWARSWLTKNMICGGAGFIRGSCNGDSGGGLICYDLPKEEGEEAGNPANASLLIRDGKTPYLAGITSFGVQPCGQLLFPSVFANVASMRDFIDGEL